MLCLIVPFSSPKKAKLAYKAAEFVHRNLNCETLYEAMPWDEDEEDEKDVKPTYANVFGIDDHWSEPDDTPRKVRELATVIAIRYLRTICSFDTLNEVVDHSDLEELLNYPSFAFGRYTRVERKKNCLLAYSNEEFLNIGALISIAVTCEQMLKTSPVWLLPDKEINKGLVRRLAEPVDIGEVMPQEAASDSTADQLAVGDLSPAA